jgi:hypothetical protein
MSIMEVPVSDRIDSSTAQRPDPAHIAMYAGVGRKP